MSENTSWFHSWYGVTSMGCTMQPRVNMFKDKKQEMCFSEVNGQIWPKVRPSQLSCDRHVCMGPHVCALANVAVSFPSKKTSSSPQRPDHAGPVRWPAVPTFLLAAASALVLFTIAKPHTHTQKKKHLSLNENFFLTVVHCDLFFCG